MWESISSIEWLNSNARNVIGYWSIIGAMIHKRKMAFVYYEISTSFMIILWSSAKLNFLFRIWNISQFLNPFMNKNLAEDKFSFTLELNSYFPSKKHNRFIKLLRKNVEAKFHQVSRDGTNDFTTKLPFYICQWNPK